MPFELPDDLHPDCGPVAWMLGTWRGNGRGDYPTIEPYEYGQELIFTHDGRPFFHYMARAWIVDEAGELVRNAAIETGFLRCRPEGKMELVLAHNTGFAEIWYGEAAGGKLELATDAIARTESAKEVAAGHRLYGNVEGDLLYAYDMAAVGPAAPTPPLGAAPASVTHERDSMTDLQAKLRDSGYRLTPQRELILAAVDSLGHATPDEVLAEVRKHANAVNASTVYRTLEVLEELGLVRHAHLSDRAPTYHTVTDHEHFHIVCRNCQKVVSVDPDMLDTLAAGLREEQASSSTSATSRCSDTARTVPRR